MFLLHSLDVQSCLVLSWVSCGIKVWTECYSYWEAILSTTSLCSWVHVKVTVRSKQGLREVCSFSCCLDLAHFVFWHLQTWCATGNCFSLQKEHDVAIKFFRRAIQVSFYLTWFSWRKCVCVCVRERDGEERISLYSHIEYWVMVLLSCTRLH